MPKTRKDPAPPTYSVEGETHRLAWREENIRVELQHLVLSPYGPLFGDLYAYAGDQLMNHAEGNVLSDRFRQDFVKTCGQLNGHVAWLPRVILATHHVAEELRGTAQSAREFWQGTLTVPQFLAQDLRAYDQSLVADLVYPGCITFIAAPRGLGKSNVAIVLALALAQGGRFRDADLTAARVLLLDRDNPPSLVQARLRSWGGQAAQQCHVRTREQVPPLTDRAKWAALPAEQYEAIILDSFLSSMEGVTEKESKQFTQALAVLKDLAHRGPGLLALHNTTKSAENYRGRGELADSIDILYEARDVTGWTPEGEGPWWEQLPEAGEQHWAARATRRQESQCLRLAFIASKFRLGLEPAPFILELDMRQSPWALREVTRRVTEEAETTARTKARATRDTMERAIAALQAEVSRQAAAGTPLAKQAAEVFLRNHGIRQKPARTLIESHTGTHWLLVHRPDLRAHPVVLLPIEGEKHDERNGPSADPQKPSAKKQVRSSLQQSSGDERTPSADPQKPSAKKTGSLVAAENLERRAKPPVSASIDAGKNDDDFRSSHESIHPEDADLPPGRMTFARPARREGGA